MPLIIRYKELGQDSESRLRRLKAIVDLAERQPDEVWHGAYNLQDQEATDLLQTIGAADLVAWRNRTPFVKTASGGYIIIGLTQLLADLPDPGTHDIVQTDPGGPAEYRSVLCRLSRAASLVFQEYLLHKE